ncbi:tRNA (adenosine(37)-N6)-threonylcarbamoyltransferase complex dimerization subunit type 1 TsaB [Thiothrix lacustris]|jgi:tRNA threonylcarbamoyladenosine biosynthesis protein TsaB|uniref:tRNA threonylcarbamoyladenosine biosynthesis protein TsaB n=1 Tax=Thiothrix lacustris TaxID=525917 RepID=A0ABY9MU20_9GAMM|nr:tRNA (adenosine(37)-N6)-threonylcarbamoyltransferase complex dimerization subunit type 1 TsaB [Thiothrix lacustris]WML91656.1 tRNA (adenosine(37)-N6)-threonylcarbamoyltransferase complex dimerization subunit type 1 TsaB [Thiothrix lacustris]WMP16485.1 tRNA (adenosine(37)-N6)-threonylcarbamoyltransferase complex dimerization subunit type 1 TsaB [Thiothrix lacustris]
MKLLALDTSTEACSAAVYADGVTFCEFELTPRAHTQLILPMVEKVLAAAGLRLQDVDALAIGCGPGAFTGIRIGVGVAQGLAMAADKPVIPLSTLAALAQQASVQHGATQVLVALDARMGEVYWGQYALQDGLMQLQGEEQVCAPADAPLPEGDGWFAIGHGWSAYADALQARFGAKLGGTDTASLPAAEFMLPLALAAWQAGRAVAPEEAQPVYLRNKIALTTQERLANKP